MKRLLLIGTALGVLLGWANDLRSETIRDHNVPIEFMRLHPCPANGHKHGACPGYVRDHIIPLCKGGPDTVENMQWQTTAEGKIKDRLECKK